MATKQNAINRKTQDLTIDPGVAGDSALQFDINGTGEFRIGVDDDASDAFKISQGSALGTTDTFVMTAAGERTMPLQPAFLAHLASNDNNRVGQNPYNIGTNVAYTEIYDQNADFNTNGTFTASITGRYLFYASIKIGEITAGMRTSQVQMFTSNRTYESQLRSAAAIRDSSNIASWVAEAIADMDAADTAILNMYISGGVTDTADILGQATNPITYFGGCLIV